MSIAARATAFAVLALLGGVGTVYAPVPTFTAVAIILGLGLWAFAGGRLPSLARSRVSGRTSTRLRGALVTRLVSVYLLVFWLGLVAPLAAYSPREVSNAVMAETGSLRNQVLIVTFGFVGALFLPAAIRRVDKAFQWPIVLWILYLAWASASLIWSASPALTVRNVAAFVLVSVGCFGLGTGFYGRLPNGRDLFLRHVFWAGVLSALVILLPLPFNFQQYDLLEPYWTLGDKRRLRQVRGAPPDMRPAGPCRNLHVEGSPVAETRLVLGCGLRSPPAGVEVARTHSLGYGGAGHISISPTGPASATGCSRPGCCS